jgi:hypothetical protein
MPDPRPTPIGSPVGSPLESAIESRLRELDGLKAKGLVTDAEYEQRRAAILDSL